MHAEQILALKSQLAEVRAQAASKDTQAQTRKLMDDAVARVEAALQTEDKQPGSKK